MICPLERLHQRVLAHLALACKNKFAALQLLRIAKKMDAMSAMKNIRKESHGWVVRMVRDGEVYMKYFRFSDGGVRKSLIKAKAWRDAKLKQLGPRQWRTGPDRSKPVNNTSGTVGVSKNLYNRWVAAWNEDGKQRFKTFRTKREAVAHRKEMTKQS